MALEMRTRCESCGTGLAAEGRAYICSHECTFCSDCAWRMEHVCPNCGGELLARPRPNAEGEGTGSDPEASSLFAYRVRPTRFEMLSAGPTSAEADAVQRHYDHLRALTTAGTVVLAARSLTADPASFGLVVFHAPDEAAARELMEQDPAIVEGVMQSELFPFRIALWGEMDRGTI